MVVETFLFLLEYLLSQNLYFLSSFQQKKFYFPLDQPRYFLTKELPQALYLNKVCPFLKKLEEVESSCYLFFRITTFCSYSVSASLSGNATLRSEEHTSELQSRLHLVCRLL